MRKVAVGISGGVDSAVAVRLLQERGLGGEPCEVVGVTMTLGRADEAQSVAEARRAAARLGVRLELVDLADEWRRRVTQDLRDTYLRGQTPNPCVRCNEFVKFGQLPRYAFSQLGCDLFATGHYARLERSDGRVRLLRARDRTKDQSYFLYRVDPEILARTVLPLGELTKAEVREYARQQQLEVADQGDSQDFCGGEVRAFVGAEPREGNIVTRDGKVLGRHSGIWNYTVGKRKGLGIGGGIPYYVVELRAASNEVVVAFREEAICRELRLVETVGRIDLSLPVKVRSAGEPRLLADGVLGVAPGQSAVFYDGDEIVGGGIIA